MRCQEDRVLIRDLVATERELRFGCTPFKRRLLSLLRNLHAPSRDHEWITGTRMQATVDEQLRLYEWLAEASIQAVGDGFAAIEEGFGSIARMRHCRRCCNGGASKVASRCKR